MGTLLLLLALQGRAEADAAVLKGLETLREVEGELAGWARTYAGRPHRGLPPPASTTSAALQAMIHEHDDLRGHLARIAICAQQLIDTQCRDGLWDEGRAVEPPQIELPPPRPKRIEFGAPRYEPKRQMLVRRGEGGVSGSSELARWALWGLLAGERAGLIPPAEVVDKAAAAWRRGAHDAADVVSALSICLHFQKRDWRKDVDVLKALDRLAAEARTTPKALYGVKVAMLHFGAERLGGVEWHKRDTALLLASQLPDGSWGDAESTAYAVLTLHYPRYVIPDPRGARR